PADRRLVVVRAAGMEVDDRPLGGGADVFSRPALESSSREAWERGVTVNAEQALAKPTQRAVPQRPVRQGGNRCPEPSEHARPGGLENCGGRSVSRSEAEAVARALPPRNGTRESRPRRIEVLVDRRALEVDRASACVDGNARAGECVLVEVVGREARLVLS